MNSLSALNFQDKRVLVRCDFNVPLWRGKVLDDFKMRTSLETINYLRAKGAKIILLSHLDSPSLRQSFFYCGSRKRAWSLKPVQERLRYLLGCEVKFAKKCVGKRTQKQARKMRRGEILLLENLRLEKGELENDLGFAKELAKMGDCFVQEAISACHRSHASIVLLPGLLPHCCGLNFQKEYAWLLKLRAGALRPFIVVIGGSKIESKAQVVKNFLNQADHVLLGGKVANALLAAKGIFLSSRPFEKEIFEGLKSIHITDPKLHIPFDVKVSPQKDHSLYLRESGPARIRKEEAILDIGSETVSVFSDIIAEAKTIFWTGVMGLVEEEKYISGTKQILDAIVSNKQALKVAGGGETIAFIRKFGSESQFSFLLTGGGASLSFLAGQELPGIQALES